MRESLRLVADEQLIVKGLALHIQQELLTHHDVRFNSWSDSARKIHINFRCDIYWSDCGSPLEILFPWHNLIYCFPSDLRISNILILISPFASQQQPAYATYINNIKENAIGPAAR